MEGQDPNLLLAGAQAVNTIAGANAQSYETAALNQVSDTLNRASVNFGNASLDIQKTIQQNELLNRRNFELLLQEAKQNQAEEKKELLALQKRYENLDRLKAENDFQYFYESEFKASANTLNPSETFVTQMNSHIDGIIRAYPGLKEESIIKMKGAVQLGSVRIIPEAKAVNEKNIFNDAKRTYFNYTINSVQLPKEVVSSAIDQISNTVKETSKNPEILAVNEILAENAKQISSDREEASRTGFSSSSNFKTSIIPIAPTDLTQSTTVDTDMVILQEKNPLLARAFLMIKGKTDDEVAAIMEHIRKISPNSPDLYQINVASSLRKQQLSKDALTFGENQNYFLPDNIRIDEKQSNPQDLRVRFSHSSYMYKTFGTTSLLKQDEKAYLKAMDSTLRGITFMKMTSSLEYYNKTNPKNQIPSDFLARDLSEVDGDLYQYMHLSRHFPEIQLANYPLIQNIIENDKLSPEKLLLNVKNNATETRLLSTVDGGVNMIKMLIANAQLKGDFSANTLNSFFGVTDGYFYPKQAPNGPQYQQAARELMGPLAGTTRQDALYLKNVDVDAYAVIRKNGNPVLYKGVPVKYSAQFLEDFIQKNKS